MPTNNSKPQAAQAAQSTPEVEIVSLRQRKLEEMKDETSAIRNQDTPEDIVDHQLLTNAPAQTIQAMTGWSMERIQKRADELETTLKGSLAGDFKPAA